MVLIAPNDANRRCHSVELSNEVKHPRAVARNARVVAQTLGTKDSVRAAVAKADHCDTTVATRQSADINACVCHVGFSSRYLLKPRL